MSLLEHPGFAATVFVPTDQAVQEALDKYGNSLDVSSLIRYHIVPPSPKTNGLWTTPFMSLGPQMETLNTGAPPLTTSKFTLPADVTWRGGLTGFQVIGASNSANVVQSDINACKGYVNMIDSVLLP